MPNQKEVVMKINKNDPRLTAYVLNELDTNERNLIEKAIQADPELQSEVLLLQKTVGVLLQQQDQEVYRLSPEQRDKIFPKTKSIWSMWPALGAGLVTASLALIIFNRTNYNQPADMAMAPPAQYRDEVSAAKPDVSVAPAAPAPAPEKLAREQQKEASAPAVEQALVKSDTLGATGTSGGGAAAGMLAESETAQRLREEKKQIPAAVASAPKPTEEGEALMAADSLQPIAANEMKSEDSSLQPSLAKAKTTGNFAMAKKGSADSLARGAQLAQKKSGFSINFGSKLSVEPVLTETMNSEITKALTDCWNLSLASYKLIGYNYTYQVEWNVKSGQALNVNWTSSQGSRTISEDLRQCWTLAIQKQNWQGIKDVKLIYELNIVSK